MKSLSHLLRFALPAALAFTVSGMSLSAVATDLDIIDKQHHEIPPPPKSGPALEIVSDASTGVPDDSQRFILGGLSVEGATVFTEVELTAPYEALRGQEISFAQLTGIAGEMTRQYREAGYLLSRVVVPAGRWDAQDARIRLVALEGFLDAVRYEGDAALAGPFESYWNAVKARLLSLRPLKHADFERELLLLQDLPGLEVASRFEEAGSEAGGEAGASTLILTLTRKPVSLNFNGGNTGTRSAGRGMVNLTAELASLPFIGGKTAFTWSQAVHRREYYAFTLAHDHQFANGLVARASYTASESPKPDSDFARIFDYETESRTFTAGINYPFLRSRALNLSAGVNYEHRNGKSDLANAPYTRDRLRNLTLEANFDFSDEWGGVTQLAPSFTRGLSIHNATDRDVDASSPNAPAKFNRFKLYASRNQSLPRDFSVFVAAEVQSADTSLSSYNRYSVGGTQFGRGYLPGVIENDQGLAASLEARWQTGVGSLTVQPFVFADYGKTWAAKKLPGAVGKESLRSAGLGFRLMGRLPGPNPVGREAGRFTLTAFAAKPQKAIYEVETSDERYMLQAVFAF
jgi:hemolysin activation/secretion protein